MKIDRYVKTVLTVIAALLALLVLRPILASTPSHAANPIQYKIVDSRGSSPESTLNQYGKEGWELVWVYQQTGIHVFKR